MSEGSGVGCLCVCCDDALLAGFQVFSRPAVLQFACCLCLPQEPWGCSIHVCMSTPTCQPGMTCWCFGFVFVFVLGRPYGLAVPFISVETLEVCKSCFLSLCVLLHTTETLRAAPSKHRSWSLADEHLRRVKPLSVQSFQPAALARHPLLSARVAVQLLLCKC